MHSLAQCNYSNELGCRNASENILKKSSRKEEKNDSPFIDFSENESTKAKFDNRDKPRTFINERLWKLCWRRQCLCVCLSFSQNVCACVCVGCIGNSPKSSSLYWDFIVTALSIICFLREMMNSSFFSFVFFLLFCFILIAKLWAWVWLSTLLLFPEVLCAVALFIHSSTWKSFKSSSTQQWVTHQILSNELQVTAN